MRLDKETAQAIADCTRGTYFHAGTAEDLKKVYQHLNTRLVLERKDVGDEQKEAILGANARRFYRL